MSNVTRVDHIAYAVGPGMIEKWGWYHIEIEGGQLTKKMDDVRPDDPDSSMKLWCIDFKSFGIVLAEGIDRRKKSQVTVFAERHGDHSVQHIAFDTDDLDRFIERAVGFGVNLRGRPAVNNDGFGQLKQLFGKGYSPLNAAEMSFPEYVQRPKAGHHGEQLSTSVPESTGRNFYQLIEDARENGDISTLIDFAKMPMDWVPQIHQANQATAKQVRETSEEEVLGQPLPV